MVTTSQTKASPLLAPYVRSYIYREFDTKGYEVVKPKHASHYISMHFFFKGLPLKLTDPTTGLILKRGNRSGISGMSSQYIGDMTFNGFYSFFEILFTPHGFSTLFNIPSGEVLDKIIASEELFDSSINILHEQLYYCSNIHQMAAVADAFLLNPYKKQKHNKLSRISHIIQSINRRKGIIKIDALAADVNMSVRNFERHFTAHTNIPAKLYCCIARFNNALEMKQRNPKLSWTKIAYQTGYFDQMHMVKDFKKFSGYRPFALFKETPLLEETVVD